MRKQPRGTKPGDVEDLRELISRERARLRWRIAKADDASAPQTPDARRRKLYRVFTAALGD